MFSQSSIFSFRTAKSAVILESTEVLSFEEGLLCVDVAMVARKGKGEEDINRSLFNDEFNVQQFISKVLPPPCFTPGDRAREPCTNAVSVEAGRSYKLTNFGR